MMCRMLVAALALGVLSAANAALAQDAAQAAAGERAFNEFCADCHGQGLNAKVGVPDLRKLRPNQRQYFNTSVLDGRAPEMPSWRGIVSEEQLEQIWAYIQAN